MVAAQLFAPNNKEKRKPDDDLKNEVNKKIESKRNYNVIQNVQSKCSKHMYRAFGKYFLSITQSFIGLTSALDPSFPKKRMTLHWNGAKSMDPEPHFFDIVHS